jgi:hypothetical protein
MLLLSISLNTFILLVTVGLGFWGVYVLLFVGGRQPKKGKRPMPGPYTFFHPTAGDGGDSFKGSVPLSSVNLDELRRGILDPTNPKATTSPLPAPSDTPDALADSIPDDNPDFALPEDEFANDEPGTLAHPRQVPVFDEMIGSEATPSPTLLHDLVSYNPLDEDVLDQVEAIFGNTDQMELLDQYHTETNRLMQETGEAYHTIFYRLIQDECAANQTYLTSMLVAPGTPEPTLTMATVLAMSDEEELDF